RLRADFVSGVSHELRTPLAQIRMFSETLLLGRVRSDDERERSLEIIDQEARRLTHLVENLLHFSRSERRLARLSPALAPLAPLVSEAAEGCAPLAAARGVTSGSELADGVVAPVDADALRQMLLSLLDNAVKYGPSGQTVTLALAVADGRARVSVDDEGPGIPAAERERIWDRFWRLERDRGSAVAGTGIGLSVVRELVALHGGRTWGERAPAAHRHPRRALGRVRQGARPASGGGRLRHKAVRRARAPGPSGSAVAAHRATGRRRRRARAVRRCGSHPRVPLRAAERPAGGAHPEGVRPASRVAPTRRSCRQPYGAAHRGVGVQRRGVEPHRGHARGRAATQARDRSRGAATYPHRAQGRLPTREITCCSPGDAVKVRSPAERSSVLPHDRSPASG